MFASRFDPDPPSLPSPSSQGGEAGYSWFFLSIGRSWWWGLLVTLLFIGSGGAFYVWYSRYGSDPTPDGLVGLSYAGAGTFLLLLAGGMYTLRRRVRKRALGQLNASLNWHIFLAVMGLAAICMHSFGNFNLISGTYALYGLIALSLSGLVGRFLDRLLPRLIAANVARVLTRRGEDRITTVSQKLQAIVIHNTQEQLQPFSVATSDRGGGVHAVTTSPFNDMPVMPINTPWDLAYISLEPTQQELDRDARHYRFIPDKKSGFNRPGGMMPGAQEHMESLQDMESAMKREQFYRHCIRSWRMVHIMLAFVTLGLVIWHIIFALHIMFPAIVPY